MVQERGGGTKGGGAAASERRGERGARWAYRPSRRRVAQALAARRSGTADATVQQATNARLGSRFAGGVPDCRRHSFAGDISTGFGGRRWLVGRRLLASCFLRHRCLPHRQAHPLHGFGWQTRAVPTVAAELRTLNAALNLVQSTLNA